ncbi:MAG: cation:proton antiporter [Candidatus Saganbacteria bacterium]|nr:cation:proton antiporter [Candidatus Saganbacteria bacterium]
MNLANVLWELMIILAAARLGAALARRLKQPVVLGELTAGVVTGASLLGWVRPNETINLLAQFGAIILLFEAGLATDYPAFMKVKLQALLVALAGVVCPFVLGYFLSLGFGLNDLQAVFIGATLTATSIGITVRVFRDLGRLKDKEARIVIGAAVVDDIIGLIILAAVVGLATAGAFSLSDIFRLTATVTAWLGGSLLLGNLYAGPLLKFVHQLNVRGLLFGFAGAFCLSMAWLAALIGLAPIVGAFAAGLVLSRTEHQGYVTRRLGPLAAIFVPVFFVMMGAAVDAAVFNPLVPANWPVLLLAFCLLAAALAGKIASGFVVSPGLNRLAIGVGMVPRGEVGLIFAACGLAHCLFDAPLYAALLAVIFLTTLITPPLLGRLLEK